MLLLLLGLGGCAFASSPAAASNIPARTASWDTSSLDAAPIIKSKDTSSPISVTALQSELELELAASWGTSSLAEAIAKRDASASLIFGCMKPP